MPSLDLTLIVAAAARDMGIGRNGTLPWKGLKKEMAYFARVTKRPPPSALSASSEEKQQTRKLQNAVIMGRKTWESIPPKFRPLPGRLNVVISRTVGDEVVKGGVADEAKRADVLTARSLEEALALLQKRHQDEKGDGDVGRVFVIGGAQIYDAALALPETRRIVLTRVRKEEGEFECDAFFPVRLDAQENGGSREWRRVSQEEMDAWVGEEVPRGVQREAGAEYEFEMWERMSS